MSCCQLTLQYLIKRALFQVNRSQSKKYGCDFITYDDKLVEDRKHPNMFLLLTSRNTKCVTSQKFLLLNTNLGGMLKDVTIVYSYYCTLTSQVAISHCNWNFNYVPQINRILISNLILNCFVRYSASCNAIC